MKHLRYFEALSRHAHFGRAAEDCAVTQPALSMQIKELEAILGAPLVERGARKLHLTPLGEAFATRARAILRAVDDLGDLARASGQTYPGPLRLGVIPTIAPYLLPGVIAGLARRFPALEVRPRETVTRRLVADLQAARLDAAIVALPVSEPTLDEMPLFSEEFVLVRPPGDADRPVPRPENLAEMRLLLLEEGHCFRDQALSVCRLSDGPPRDLMEGSSLSTLVQMVGAGIGVTLLPQMALPVETRAAAVSLARLPAPRPSRQIGLIWRRANPLAGWLRQMGEVVREAGQVQTQA